MLLSEPPPSAADLQFSIAGIPVRVHPFFWLMTLFLAPGKSDAKLLLTWVVAVFVGILVHEMGHAVVQRYFGYLTHVVLYGLGGVTVGVPGIRRGRRWPQWLEDIAISLAGPAAGFLLPALILLLLWAMGRGSLIYFGWGFIPFVDAGQFAHPIFGQFLNFLVWIGFLWGFVNLLPVYPLDGGQIARVILMRLTRRGLTASLWLSLATCAAVAAWGLSMGSLFMTVFFAILGFQNYQMLQSVQRQGW